MERHHIFGASHKARSEARGFIMPLARNLHPNGVAVGKQGHEVDTVLKQMARDYYIEHYGTEEEFIQEFKI